GGELEADWATVLGLAPVPPIVWQQIGNNTARATAMRLQCSFGASNLRRLPCRPGQFRGGSQNRPDTGQSLESFADASHSKHPTRTTGGHGTASVDCESVLLQRLPHGVRIWL